MPAQRIDFKHIRQRASFADVLTHYDIELQKDGTKAGQFKCLCPFHEDTKPSMKVNTDRNIFNCFPCNAGGNILEFVMQMDDIEIRPAAKLVAEISAIAMAPGGSKRPQRAAKPNPKQSKSPSNSKTARPQDTAQDEPNLDESEQSHNPPLSFELKNLVLDHPFIAEREIDQATQDAFGIGIATRGIMKDRLVFPIHNSQGELVAYCGRYVGNDIPEDEAKYKQPPKFRKEWELFNWHRVAEEGFSKPLILVESFFSVLRLHRLGYPVVSPMGRSLSEQQIARLQEAGVVEIILLFDGDDPGRQAVITIGRNLLTAGIACSAPIVAENFKPHRCTNSQLHALLA